MSRKKLNEAREHYDRLLYIARNHGLVSDEALYHWSKLHDCYRTAPREHQFVIHEIVVDANKAWDDLNARTRAFRAAEEQRQDSMQLKESAPASPPTPIAPVDAFPADCGPPAPVE